MESSSFAHKESVTLDFAGAFRALADGPVQRIAYASRWWAVVLRCWWQRHGLPARLLFRGFQPASFNAVPIPGPQ